MLSVSLKWVSDNREAIRSGMKEMFSKGEFKVSVLYYVECC